MERLTDFFQNRYTDTNGQDTGKIHSCPELIECVQQIGFLLLLESGIQGYSAESLMAEECRYVTLPDGGWEWPLWEWKGQVVTEDFVYPLDKHGHEYGWGLSLLTTPEELLGTEACRCNRTPEESYQRMFDHLRQLLPEATEKQIQKILK